MNYVTSVVKMYLEFILLPDKYFVLWKQYSNKLNIYINIKLSRWNCESLFSAINCIKSKQKNITLLDEANAVYVTLKKLRLT